MSILCDYEIPTYTPSPERTGHGRANAGEALRVDDSNRGALVDQRHHLLKPLFVRPRTPEVPLPDHFRFRVFVRCEGLEAFLDPFDEAGRKLDDMPFKQKRLILIEAPSSAYHGGMLILGKITL
jgi:hypothetical protein